MARSRRVRLFTFAEIEDRLFSCGMTPVEVSRELDEEWQKRAQTGGLSRREQRTDLACRLLEAGDVCSVAWAWRVLRVAQGPIPGPPRDPIAWLREHAPFVRTP
jgi:hypothetical protein